ncbi:MAG: hypothetical protein K2Q10_12745 [Rhodospirillales bacterium]|nr:hypothetical protein [Rhodospirillales bacterium]
MKAGIYYTGSGPIAILTSYPSLDHPDLVAKLRAKGIDKFIAYEVPVELARQRYGSHFGQVLDDRYETDDLRVLDDDGPRVFRRFRIAEFGQPVIHEEIGKA